MGQKQKVTSITLSPSKVGILKTCKRRFLFESASSTNKGKEVGSHPSSLVGNVVHKFLERNNYRYSRGDEILFDELWNEVYKVESRKYFNILENRKYEHPPFYWLPKFAVKRSLSYELARKERVFNKTLDSYEHKHEKKVEYGFLFGFPDYFVLKKDKKEAIIKDYKSGLIYHYDEDGNKGKIKEEYLDQIKTYGLLVSKEFKVDPDNIWLFLISLNREKFSIRFSKQDYENHYTDLKDLLHIIQKSGTATEKKELANPSLENCKFCNYKLQCEKFKEKLWSEELYKLGFLHLSKEMITFSNSKTSEICVSLPNKDDHISIVNIPDHEMNNLIISKEMSLSNLFYNDQASVFYWTKNTIVY